MHWDLDKKRTRIPCAACTGYRNHSEIDDKTYIRSDFPKNELVRPLFDDWYNDLGYLDCATLEKGGCIARSPGTHSRIAKLNCDRWDWGGVRGISVQQCTLVVIVESQFP